MKSEKWERFNCCKAVKQTVEYENSYNSRCYAYGTGGVDFGFNGVELV
ncbi:MAG: hypothetical protein LR001_00400 [Clostridiales bacterium]|nr:hypothetical protein [Clostridiales bacterium]